MSKEEKREAAYRLINDFFNCHSPEKAREIYGRIEKIIFDRVEAKHNFKVCLVSMDFYKADVDHYINALATAPTKGPTNGDIFRAYKALRGIIDLVDILKPIIDQN